MRKTVIVLALALMGAGSAVADTITNPASSFNMAKEIARDTIYDARRRAEPGRTRAYGNLVGYRSARQLGDRAGQPDQAGPRKQQSVCALAPHQHDGASAVGHYSLGGRPCQRWLLTTPWLS